MSRSLMNRAGSFTVSRLIIEQYPDLVLALMARCIVVKAEMLCAQDAIEYTALSADFREVQRYAGLPNYTPVFRDGQFDHWETGSCPWLTDHSADPRKAELSKDAEALLRAISKSGSCHG